ncbi:MAG: hypothetical protein ACRDR6_11950 [Pseudonocardiaceae bacterium]
MNSCDIARMRLAPSEQLTQQRWDVVAERAIRSSSEFNQLTAIFRHNEHRGQAHERHVPVPPGVFGRDAARVLPGGAQYFRHLVWSKTLATQVTVKFVGI